MDFLSDIRTSDEADLPVKAPKLAETRVRKPPVGWSAERSAQSTEQRVLAGNAAGFKGIEEGGTGELTSEGPGLPFRILETKLIAVPIYQGVIETTTAPHNKDPDLS